MHTLSGYDAECLPCMSCSSSGGIPLILFICFQCQPPQLVYENKKTQVLSVQSQGQGWDYGSWSQPGGDNVVCGFL